MPLGHSKNHRLDLPQLKTDGRRGPADEPLYLPLIRRVRQQLGRKRLRDAGDGKMAALETRAEVAAHGDDYLMPLPRAGEVAQGTAGLAGASDEPVPEAVRLESPVNEPANAGSTPPWRAPPCQ